MKTVDPQVYSIAKSTLHMAAVSRKVALLLLEDTIEDTKGQTSHGSFIAMHAALAKLDFEEVSPQDLLEHLEDDKAIAAIKYIMPNEKEAL